MRQRTKKEANVTNSPSPFDANTLTDEEKLGLQAILATIPEGDDTEPPDRYTTTAGIVFQLRSIPPLLVTDAQAALKQPRPPRIPNRDLDPDGKVMMENLNDPTFIEELRAYKNALSEVSNAIFLTRGTKIVTIPDGVETVESTDWSDDLKDLAGLAIPDTGRRRYYCWLKYVALANMKDLTSVLRKVSSFAGVTLEADVAVAADTFRSNAQGDAALGLHPTEGDGLGDRSASDGAGTGTGVRVPGSGDVHTPDVERVVGPIDA